MRPISLLALIATLSPVAGGPCLDTAPKPLRSVAPKVYTEIAPEYGARVRMFQGIPGIERSGGGRLWATWYGGGVTEDRHNYVLLSTSGDDGKIWNVVAIVDPDGDGPIRAFDPCLWVDPKGTLWLFWSQADTTRRGPKGEGWSRAGGDYAETWAMRAENPDAEAPNWGAPQRLFGGIMMNKPTALSDGRWLMPVAWWYQPISARVVETRDGGKTWKEIGGASVRHEKRRNCDEHMIVERRDGALWMLVRMHGGYIGESVSTDGGRTWEEVAPSDIAHTTSRFFVRRLRSGRLLLVKHGPIDERTSRKQLMAFVSDDDGKTWQGGLMLDERGGVSYPDGTQSPEGAIYIAYDYDRRGEKFIHMAVFTEEDVLAGKPVSDKARLRVAIDKADGENPRTAAKKAAEAIVYASNEDGAKMLEGPPARLEAIEGEAQTIRKGARIFTDRSAYKWKDVPEQLAGKRFIQSSIGGTRAVCLDRGVVYVATPARSRNRDSLTKALTDLGFVKTDLPEFLLFDAVNAPGNVCTTYRKTLEPGENLELGKWGVVIF